MENPPVTAARPHPKIPESVLVVIHTAEGDVLLLERADRPGYWQSVTGSRDTPDEPLRATAVREVQEETGIVVGPAGVPEDCLRDWHTTNRYEIYPHWRHRYAPGVTHNTEHVYDLLVPRDIAVRVSPREHTARAWLPWPEAAARCFSPSNAAACRALGERLHGARAPVGACSQGDAGGDGLRGRHAEGRAASPVGQGNSASRGGAA